MGLETRTEKLNAQNLSEHSAECNVETQINLPDYCSDIKRIIKCNITPSISSTELMSGKADVKGSVSVRVVYVGEKDRIDCCEVTESFACSHSFDYEKDCDTVNVLPVINYVNCRASSQRRVGVSASIGLKFTVCSQKSREILIKAEGDGVQCKVSRETADNLICCSRKVFEMSETATVSSDKSAIGKILFSKSFAVIDSKKAVSGKLLIKGELYTKIIYCAEDGSVHLFEHTMPISQILDITGLTEECTVGVAADVIQSAVCARSDSSGDNRLVEIAVKVAVVVKGTSRQTYNIVEDCYCTQYLTDTGYENGAFSRLVHSADRQITFKNTVDIPGLKQVCCVWPCETQCSMDAQTNKATGKIDVLLGFVYTDDKNSISYCEKNLELIFNETLNESYDKLSCLCRACVRDIQFSSEQKDKINLTLQAGIIAEVYHNKEKKILSRIELMKDSPKKSNDAALVIYFAQKDEKLWDIARQYNTTVELIKQENDIEAELTSDDMMLMIPCV